MDLALSRPDGRKQVHALLENENLAATFSGEARVNANYIGLTSWLEIALDTQAMGDRKSLFPERFLYYGFSRYNRGTQDQ